MQFKITAAAVAAILVTAVAAIPNPAGHDNVARGEFDHGALAELFTKRGIELSKRCDIDFYETCIESCPVGGECPGCQVGCTIGCCGSTGCC